MFELLTVTYGTKPALFLAIKCLHELAELEKENFPIASQVITRDFYVDDLLTGSDTLQGVVDLKEQVVELLSRGGFELHKWKTNIASMQEKGRLLDINRDHESKLLGVLWDSDEDVLYYKSPITKFENSVTKRIILSEVARLFDLLGLVGPVITAAKILI